MHELHDERFGQFTLGQPPQTHEPGGALASCCCCLRFASASCTTAVAVGIGIIGIIDIGIGIGIRIAAAAGIDAICAEACCAACTS